MRLALLALLLVASPGWAAPPEMRGLWVVRTALVSPEEVDRVVDQAAEAGFNALFVQVRGRGDAFYESRSVPRSPMLKGREASFDPLARLLERAHARGLQVHAWVNVLLSASFRQPLAAEHVVARHPEWIMVPRGAAKAGLSTKAARLPDLVRSSSAGDSDVEGYYLSPAAAGVAEHLEDVVHEIVRDYAVQGLHLDFIRYPGPDYDYSKAALQGFRRRRGGSGDLLAGPTADAGGWSDYRRDLLTALADRLSRTARAARPGVIISAAAVPDEAQALHHKFQAWPSWLSRGILDAVCPMAYTPDTNVFRRQVEVARARASAEQGVWAGVGAYRLSFEGILEKVRAAREVGASGVVLFSNESFGSGDWKRLREEAFPLPVGADRLRVPVLTGGIQR